MISKAVFAGTFDPFTLGHFEIAERAAKRFDEVIVAVADVTGKTCMFSFARPSLYILVISRRLFSILSYLFNCERPSAAICLLSKIYPYSDLSKITHIQKK